MKKQLFKNLKEDIALTKRGLNIVKTLMPYNLTLKAIRAVLKALTPFIGIYLSGLILNELAGDKNPRTLLILVSLIIGLTFLIDVINHGMNKIVDYKDALYNHKYQMTLSEKVLSMDYEHVENSEIHMHRQRIDDLSMYTGGGVGQIVYSFEAIINYFFKIIFSIAITYNVFVTFSENKYTGFLAFVNSPIFSIVLLLIIVGNVIFFMRISETATKKMQTLSKAFMKLNRFFNYYLGSYVGTYHAGKDIRIYNQKKFLVNEMDAYLDGIGPGVKELGNHQIFYQIINIAMSVFISGTVYVFVGLKSLLGIFPVGNIVQYIGSIHQFIDAFTALMSIVNGLRVNGEAMRVYFDFIDLPDKLHKGTLPIEKRDDNEYEFEFKNVSFKYPGSDNYALKNVSMKLRVGQRMAVVGMNGSGKTTMIKLLCRLYDPTEGEIFLNGFNIKKYDYKEYMSVFSVVFQDFKLFSFLLGQNVAASMEYDKESVVKFLDESGFGERFSKMENGLDTPLYKDFSEDGVEISGGEAQKIALARALYKDAPFIVLDEPTSALDPIAEFEVYSKFNEIVGDKTAIYISHRLSSCRFCDDIVVFHEGELIQRGSHDELISDLDGKYNELWNAQAQYYAENKG
jgi:ABC-type multidrug transport system, ATPase and permease components